MSEKSPERSGVSHQLASKPICLLIAVAPAIAAMAGGRECQLRSWCQDAISVDPSVSAPAITSLRQAGAEGLDALFEAHAELLKSGRKSLLQPDGAESDQRWARLTAALDAVARARDTYAARLFWHTDWDRAVAASKDSGRPILSLRLLGNLDDEYSCANSRFFRTALYANAEISRYLRDHYVLHWKSVRPVPRVNIDFGDGRKLERTLTGNSIHYVLDADGRIIDALPGLYGPGRFLRELRESESVASAAQRMPDVVRPALLHEHYQRCASTLRAASKSDMTQAGVSPPAEDHLRPASTLPDARDAARNAQTKRLVEMPLVLASVPDHGLDGRPEAHSAMPRAASKARFEAPLLRGIGPSRAVRNSAVDDAAWSRIAALHPDDARLDEASLRFMREKSPLLRNHAGRHTGMAERFNESMAVDTVRNEYLYRLAIHEWLVEDGYWPTVDELNGRVYADLFLTPGSDPWLGLLPADVYTALAEDGVTQTAESDRALPQAGAVSSIAQPVVPEGT